MYCLKCGKETNSTAVFCDACLDSMEKYPIKPGTPIHLPHRETSKKPAARKHVQSMDVQLAILQKKVHRLRLVSLVLAVAFCLALALLVRNSLISDPPEPTGRNYTIQTS